MTYNVSWSATSLRQLEKLDNISANRVINKAEAITKDPFSFVQKLKGFNLYKLRVGDYRVIMSIESSKMIIFVLEVGHRSVVYRKY